MGNCISEQRNVESKSTVDGKYTSHKELDRWEVERSKVEHIDHDESTFVSVGTHHLNQNNESFHYEDVKVAFYEHVYRRNWNKALEVLAENKSTPIANYVDRYNRCPLHWATIKGCSTTFLKRVIENFPLAVSIRDRGGRTPLHLACEFASDQVVLALLRVTGTREIKYRDSHFMRTILSEAIAHSRSIFITEAILNADKSQIMTKDIQGNTPIVIFFRMNLGSILAPLDLDVNADELVEIASLLLETEQEITSGVKRQNHSNILTNAIKCSSCPLAFVDFLLLQMPKLSRTHDENGDLPIHVACRLREHKMECYKCDECGNGCMDEIPFYFNHASLSLHHVLCEKCVENENKAHFVRTLPGLKISGTVKALLFLNIKDAKAESSAGELPLVIALKAGQTWSRGAIRDLVDIYPAALSIKDKGSDLFPFQLAAAERDYQFGADLRMQRIRSLQTIHELLLIWPMSDRTCLVAS